MTTASLRLKSLAILALAVAGCQSSTGMNGQPQSKEQTLARANPQMKAVLDELMALDPKPIEQLSPQIARQQPTPTDAVKNLLKKKGKSADPEPVGDVTAKAISTDDRTINTRVYKPKSAGGGALPTIVYVRGGGWVIATLDTYDASCRALANGAGAIVVSVDYRMAPENKFPAAHEDVYAVTQWVLDNATELGGDKDKVALVGESAGGNMVLATALAAKKNGGKLPKAIVAVYPVADPNSKGPSHVDSANAAPLNQAMLPWFFSHTLENPGQAKDYRLDLVNVPQNDLAGLPPTTVILAGIDPLRSDGEMMAKHLKAAGVDTVVKTYPGVTHEFFGMGAVLDDAKAAEKLACERIKEAVK
jgi:acetyl esterase